MRKLILILTLVIVFSAISFASGTNSINISVVDQITNSSLSNCTVEIVDSNGVIYGRYTTNLNGNISIYGIPNGSYKLKSVKLPIGYEVNNDVGFNAKNGTHQTVILQATKINGVVVRKLDSITKKPIKNIKLLIMDFNKNPIKEVVTDNFGQAIFESVASSGIYYIREVTTTTNYKPDINDYKIVLNNYNDAYIDLFSDPISGTIAILTRASESSINTNIEKGQVIPNVVYGIFDKNTKEQILTIRSYKDFAIAKLPIGEYFIKQLSSNYGFAPNEEVRQIRITKENETISMEVENIPNNVEVHIESSGPSFIISGIKGKYIISNAMNRSNSSLEDFYIEYVLPKDVLKANYIETGLFNKNKQYNVIAKTNKRDILVRSGLSSIESHRVDLSTATLNLDKNEVVSSVVLVWSSVPSGFTQMSDIELDVTSIKKPTNSSNSYVIKTNVGGMINDDWVIDNEIINTRVK